MPSSLLLSTTFTASSCTPTSTLPFITQPSFKNRTKQAHGFRVSCKASPKDNENQLILPETQKLILPDNVDRRKLLVGLGGLYTAANIASLPSALANPIETPNIDSAQCDELTSGIKYYKKAVRPRVCCPPKLGKDIKDYELPKDGAVRMRWAAHDKSDEKKYKENVEKYKLGIYMMRQLDKTEPENPHSFSQQAKIHCAYCNGGYTQVGFPEMNLQIHNSWLFFPFHRWYLYFYERIIGKLIDDDTFALPYWNWDNPAGMTVPEMFIAKKDDSFVADIEKNNPLFDKYRDARHLPPQAVNLFFNDNERKLDSKKQKACNLSMVYRDLISNATNWEAFFGGEYVAGNKEPEFQGSVEQHSHTSVHRWVGDSEQFNGEDMGNFYSAGYDPLFYVHHANVDRMWKLWKDMKDLPGHKEPASNDWLNASYLFYDEKEKLVRVYNKDCVNLQDLKYDYAKSDTPWLKSRPTRREEKSKDLSSATVDVKTVEEALKDPARVDPLLKVRVKRPAKRRSDEEKKQAEEKLFITGIEFSTDKFVKFDVFVNDNFNTTRTTKFPTPCDPEFAGSYAQIPHSGHEQLTLAAASFGLNELLEDTKTEDEEYALVALVAREGCEDLTVSGIKIELVRNE